MSLKSKLKSSKGETMTESLFSMLMTALAVSMFLNFIIISGRIMDRAKERENHIRTAMTFMERMEEDSSEDGEVKKDDSGELNVSISSKSGKKIADEQFSVDVYYSPYGAAYQLEE